MFVLHLKNTKTSATFVRNAANRLHDAISTKRPLLPSVQSRHTLAKVCAAKARNMKEAKYFIEIKHQLNGRAINY